MGRTVEEVIKQLQEENEILKKKVKRRILREKKEKLIELGICEKVYVSKKESKDPNVKTESNNGKTHYYKLVAKEVTDEEWDNLIKIEEENTMLNQRLKPSESIFTAFGLVTYFIGFVVGLIIQGYWMLVIFFSAFIFGTLFFGISQIKQLIKDLKK